MAASTGSPASRRSTKFTPFTTRPSLTSRQGMTRTLNIALLAPRGADHLQRFRRIEAAVVKRTAGDGAFELAGPRLCHHPDVVDRGETARCHHGRRDRIGKCDGAIPV